MLYGKSRTKPKPERLSIEKFKPSAYNEPRMRNEKGFTLIELLVVVAIIALLLSILTPSLRLAKEKAMNLLCQNDLRQYAIMAEMYLIR